MPDLINATLIANSVNKLRTSIEQFNAQTVIQNKRMYRLTLAVTILTVVLIFAVIAQIYMKPRPKPSPVMPNLSMTYTEYLKASAEYKERNAP